MGALAPSAEHVCRRPEAPPWHMGGFAFGGRDKTPASPLS